jgi:metal-responsive CopG/Arc/MetJ family transcriptional regulator
MKTISFTIDPPLLEELDIATRGRSRSETIRNALRAGLDQRRRAAGEEREARVVAHHRELLAHQAAALLDEQAEP